MQRCRIQFADDPTAHIPLVFEELSTPSVIAMEFIEGVSIDDLDGNPPLECRAGRSRGDRCADPAQADLRVRLLPRRPASGKPPRPARGA